MSYDLQAFRLPPGMDPEAWIAGDERADEPPTPEQRRETERLVAAVLDHDLEGERFDDDDVIELDYDPIQISFFAGEVGLSMPYWFEGEEAEAMTARLFGFADVLIREGLTVWDPQADAVVEGGAASRASRVVGDTTAMLRGRRSAPRWQFWKR